MNDQNDMTIEWVRTFYRDLQEMVDTTFPKTCPKCGQVYTTKEAFLKDTIPVKDLTLEDRSGLFCKDTDPDRPAVGLFRNCTCGTTLMADFKDRRDNSLEGNLRRQRFDTLIDTLSKLGISATEAREELLKILHGQGSSLINDLLDDVNLA